MAQYPMVLAIRQCVWSFSDAGSLHSTVSYVTFHSAHATALSPPLHTLSVTLACPTLQVPVASAGHWKHRSPMEQAEEK